MKMPDASDKTNKTRFLLRTAGISSALVLLIIPIQILVYVLYPIPTSVEAWLTLFHESWLLGLLHQDLLYLINNILVAIMYLGFYIALKHHSEGIMKLALILGLLGISAYFASNKAFEMLSASNLYFAANTVSQKTMILIVGQMILSEWQGTAFLVYYVLNGITLILISFVMIKSDLFGKPAAWIGLAAGSLMMVPSTAGAIGLVFSLTSLIPWCVFCALVAAKFMKLAKTNQI
jgi:hypothetical protein